jgi:hypothetical protein
MMRARGGERRKPDGSAAVAAAVLVLVVAVARAGLRADDYQPGTGIAGTPHDFSDHHAAGAQVGACTFCHTPHRASGTHLLWNHTLPNTDYTWTEYTVTGGGTRLPTLQASWEGPSKYCLSCHDGSVTIGDIGWFNLQSWTGSRTLDDKRLEGGDFSLTKFIEGMIGNNHPVAAPYPYLQARNTYNGVTTGARVQLAGFNPDPTSLGIRLFRNPGGQHVAAGPSPGITGIECTSCHGVHNERGLVVDKPLLRGLNGGDPGNLCQKCHPNK